LGFLPGAQRNEGTLRVQQFACLAAEVPSKGANTHGSAVGDLSREPRTLNHAVDTPEGALASGFRVSGVKNAKQASAGLLTASSIPVGTAGKLVMPSCVQKILNKLY